MIGVTSFLWLIWRSGAKPSRLSYPCQQVCAANVALFLSPAVLAVACRFINWREALKPRHLISGVILSVLVFQMVIAGHRFFDDRRLRQAALTSRPQFEHKPIGKAVGSAAGAGLAVFAAVPPAMALESPHRVVSVYDAQATDWNYGSAGFHWEHIDQQTVNRMVDRGVMSLTGKDSVAAAWSELIPYRTGEDVAIKVNLNNTNSCQGGQDSQIDAYPETVNAVIDGLERIGVPLEKIHVSDPSRVVPPRFIERIHGVGHNEVRFYSKTDCGCGDGFERSAFVAADSPDSSPASCPQGVRIRPATVFVQAAHIINMPQFKSHGAYITLAYKNHFGSVIYSRYATDINSLGKMHPYFNQGGSGVLCDDLENDNLLTDITDNAHFRDKTRLVIGDGLFGNPRTNWQGVARWRIFGNDDPNILFFGVDPVATSSVMTDYIMAERGAQDHQHLAAAADKGHGVHEHWDSFESKTYSVIEYIPIEAGESELPAAPSHLSGQSLSTTRLRLTWRDHAMDETYFDLHRRTGDGSFEAVSPLPGQNDTSYADSALVPATRYSYRIRACNENGCSAWSNTVLVATAPAATMPSAVESVSILNVHNQ